MLSSLPVVLLLALFAVPKALLRSNFDHTGGVHNTFAMSTVVNDFLHHWEPTNNLMDIFVPPDCLKENTALFKTYLDNRKQPVMLWTNGEKHFDFFLRDVRVVTRNVFSHIRYFICGKYDTKSLSRSMFTNYILTDFVVLENRHPRKDPKLPFERPFLSRFPKMSGWQVLNSANGSVFLISEFGRYLVTDLNVAKHMWLARRRTLSGSSIKLSCSSSYACDHPGLSITTELLNHRNASVRIYKGPYLGKHGKGLSTFVESIAGRGTRMMLHFDVVREFESAGFTFYVRQRDRVAKETIFLFPFSWEVWAALLATSLLLVLTHGLISKVMITRNVNISAFAFPMLAAFFQQSVRINSSVLKTHSSRLIYGLMALMMVVLSTVFKGRLTALLNDPPFQGEAIQFELLLDLVRKGLRLCILEDPSVVSPAILKYYPWIEALKVNNGCHHILSLLPSNASPIKISPDGRDTFFTFNSRTGQSEGLRRELLRRGYVETTGTALSHPVGPETRRSSVYRHDIDIALSRGIEAGLYSRAAALAEYKSRSFHEGNLDNAEEPVLTLADLRPFFLAWLLGILLSILVFIGEVTQPRVACRKCKQSVRMVPQQTSGRRLRRAGVIKKISSSLSRSTN